MLIPLLEFGDGKVIFSTQAKIVILLIILHSS